MDDWSTIYQTIQVYKEIFGDLRIPSKFVVPNDDPWPRVSRNVKLGVRMLSKYTTAIVVHHTNCPHNDAYLIRCTCSSDTKCG